MPLVGPVLVFSVQGALSGPGLNGNANAQARKDKKERWMQGVTRRDWMGMAAAGAAVGGLTGSARAATGTDSLDALAKARGFVGFGSCIGGGAEDFASSFNDSGVRGIHERECGIAVCE